MRIITFGSCLSRYTANHYVKLYGGIVISSVYHNRSDAFVKRFISKEWLDLDVFNLLNEISSFSENELTNEDNKAKKIIDNQTYSEIGKHRLRNGLGLWSALKSSPDLIIVDNYMDLSAKLVYGNNDSEGFFINYNALKKEFQKKYYCDDYLTPSAGVNNMNKIIDFFKFISPLSKVIFLNFPYNTYVDSFRKERTIEYANLFDRLDCEIILPQTVDKLYQTREKQHFKAPQYAAYAGMVNVLTNK